MMNKNGSDISATQCGTETTAKRTSTLSCINVRNDDMPDTDAITSGYDRF